LITQLLVLEFSFQLRQVVVLRLVVLRDVRAALRAVQTLLGLSLTLVALLLLVEIGQLGAAVAVVVTGVDGVTLWQHNPVEVLVSEVHVTLVLSHGRRLIIVVSVGRLKAELASLVVPHSMVRLLHLEARNIENDVSGVDLLLALVRCVH